jgi:beta-phosphoglucomutase family hydrolase
MKSKLNFAAVIFDLDGVITDTAAVHSLAWKNMFDPYLRLDAERKNKPFIQFTHDFDYLNFVDGKPRYEGVSSFLESRGIKLPYGDPNDPPKVETICGLGNNKNQLFIEIIKKGNIKVFKTTINIITQLKAKGIRIGVASSSKNCKAVLEATNLLELFDTRVDGVVSVDLGLKGKPNPEIFTTACDNLGVIYDQAVIVEDAVTGVQAGRNGEFGLVLGIAREGNAEELKANGADLVIKDMGEITIQVINDWFTTHPR